jgi:EAL domain-containing protein (putative c-di-GMP-specific phosphodiesterase class I)
MSKDINIKNIIDNKAMKIRFEPVGSIIKQSIIGLEVSGVGADENGRMINMDMLFECAENEDVAINLDRLYREKAVEKFAKIYNNNKELLLFINISASIITKFIGSGIIMELINSHKINPQNIVLEIVEDKVEDIESLKRFINFYRSEGFLVALSDIGHGLANLDKISYVEPDIIKISGAITENIHYDYYKQEIFKALVNLSKNIGALVIGDGIKTKEEALTAIELGADMIEGEYFGNSLETSKEFINNAKDNITHLANEYKSYMIDKINLEKTIHKRYDNIINEALGSLSQVDELKFNENLKEVISKNEIFECIYVLNEDGIQITDTVTCCKDMISQKALIFHPAEKGTNHSLKKYYYFLKNMALNKFVTEPYVSLATGNLCITISSVFKSLNNKEYILCIDFNPKDIHL